MFQTLIRVFPWDLIDEGVEAVLDRLAGEAGATGISVPVFHPRVAALRPHRDVSPRTVRIEGGLHYQPDKTQYAATRIRPLTAEWLKKSNPLAQIAQACAERGLTLRGRVAACHSELLASRHEACAVKDVFGDVHPVWLCPSNPDVREFVRGLLTDLARYDFDSLEVTAAWFPPPGLLQQSRSSCMELGEAGEFLLALCFCESCRQAAALEGLDVPAVTRSVSVYVERVLATGEAPAASIGELLDGDAVLRSYVRWRETQVTRLTGALREACRCRLVLERSDDPLVTGAEVRSAVPRCDALMVAAASADAVEPVVREVLTETADPARIELAVSACSPPCPDSAALVRALSTAARLGVRAASIDNYGFLPYPRLAWIKQASRYAQRESE